MYEAEKQELNRLIGKGVTFEVERTIRAKQHGFLGFFKPRFDRKETLTFTIQEPTLSTLDRIADEQIELKIDEKIMSSDIGIQEAKKMVHEHGRRLAKIIAIAVLGQDVLRQVSGIGGIKYVYDYKRLEELTELFFHNVKPSKLIQLSILVNTMGNLGDFTNSIRLMSAARTTMPILVGENKED